jgi:hypothetical protein
MGRALQRAVVALKAFGLGEGVFLFAGGQVEGVVGGVEVGHLQQ